MRRASGRLDALRSLARDDLPRARELDPFDDSRHTASQATFDSLSKASEGSNAPFVAGLRRWVYELLQARVGLPWHFACLEARAKRVAATDGREVSFSEVVGELVAGPRDQRNRAGRAALSSAALRAKPVVAACSEARARRWEVARRLGLGHPMDLASAHPRSELADFAFAILRASNPLAEHVRKATPSSRGSWEVADAVALSLAPEAREGWPAVLTSRWLSEVFFAVRDPNFDASAALPVAIGGASFLRAAHSWAFDSRQRTAPRSLPFALAADPYPDSAYMHGALFAIAMTEPAFARSLGLGSRHLDAHVRALRRTLFLELRLRALRFLLAEASDPHERFGELSECVFGAAFPPELAGAWPELRADEPARWVGTLRARDLAFTLRERFDEDWFRNPKAGRFLHERACCPAWEGEKVHSTPQSIVRSFEEALG